MLKYEASYLWHLLHNSEASLLSEMRGGDERKGQEHFCSFHFGRKYFTSNENTSSKLNFKDSNFSYYINLDVAQSWTLNMALKVFKVETH